MHALIEHLLRAEVTTSSPRLPTARPVADPEGPPYIYRGGSAAWQPLRPSAGRG